MVTIKVTMRLAPDAAPALEAQFYRCFDGRHTWYPAQRVVLDPGDALAPFLDVTRSLAARGSLTLAVSPFDPAEDEWDCDWAESEVYLYTTNDGPETPDDAFLRLVRRTSKVEASAPDPELERAFELARRITGVGRVSQFSNTQDALSTGYWAQGGAEAKDLDYVLEVTPTYLPPETDAVFVELQAAHVAASAAEAARAAAAPQRERMLAYYLDAVPEYLSRELPLDASARRCLFFAARAGSRVVGAMLEAVPEREHDQTDETMVIAARITEIVSQSENFALMLRPDEVPAGGAIVGGSYLDGFHGGDAKAVERWLEAQGVECLSVEYFLDQLILLRLVDEDGEPLEQVDKLAGGPPMWTERSLGDGLFVFERNRRHVSFKLTPVLDEEPESDDDYFWVELRASDLLPGAVHTVVVPAAPR